MRSVAIVEDALDAALAGELARYDGETVEPPVSRASEAFDAVVVDRHHHAADWLAADRPTRPWAVVAVVAPTDAADPVVAGADGLVTRPVRRDDLRRVLHCVALQRTCLDAVSSAGAASAGDRRPVADDALTILRSELGDAQLFRRLL